MKYVNAMTVSRTRCTQCGKEGICIPRRAGQQREAGHLKNIYCLYCKKETNHVEIRPFGSYRDEDFDLEFKTGRFLEDGTRVPIKDLPPCKCTKCRCNINGNCWNSNGNYMDKCVQIKAAYASGNKETINLLTNEEE